MFIDLLLKSCEEGQEFLCWVTKMSQYFEDKFVQISLNFLVILCKLFQLRQTHRIRNASFYCSYLGSVRQEIIVMIIKDHTYTHTAHSRYT